MAFRYSKDEGTTISVVAIEFAIGLGVIFVAGILSSSSCPAKPSLLNIAPEMFYLLLILAIVRLSLAGVYTKWDVGGTVKEAAPFVFGLAIGIVAFSSGGTFCSSALPFDSCNPAPGLLCNTPQLSWNGTASFMLSRENGTTLYNVREACTINYTTFGISNYGPNLTLSDSYMFNSSPGQNSTLAPGTQLNVNGLHCYDDNGDEEWAISRGQVVPGAIWLMYTSAPGREYSNYNPYHIIKAESFMLKVG